MSNIDELIENDILQPILNGFSIDGIHAGGLIWAEKTCEGGEFNNCIFELNEFENVVFNDCNFSGSTFYKCIWLDCVFKASNFSTCRFINCRFVKSKFESVNVTSSLIENCEFEDCDLLHVHVLNPSTYTVNFSNTKPCMST